MKKGSLLANNNKEERNKEKQGMKAMRTYVHMQLRGE
jgi:hypothetical protein